MSEGEFFRQQGSGGERVDLVSKEKIEEEAKKQLFKVLKRLAELRQLGRYVPVHPDGIIRRYSEIEHSKEHNRLAHSKRVAYLAVKIGRQLGLSGDDLNLLKYAGLFHDVGHGPLSHGTDGLVGLIDGFEDHEKRGFKIIDKNKTYFDLLGIDIEKLKEIIGKEDGVLGTILSLSDTLSYLYFDMTAKGVLSEREKEPFRRRKGRSKNDSDHKNYFWSEFVVPLFASIESSREDGFIVVSDLRPWEKILEARARMYANHYGSRENHFRESALIYILLKYLEKECIISRQENSDKKYKILNHAKLEELLGLGDEEFIQRIRSSFEEWNNCAATSEIGGQKKYPIENKSAYERILQFAFAECDYCPNFETDYPYKILTDKEYKELPENEKNRGGLVVAPAIPNAATKPFSKTLRVVTHDGKELKSAKESLGQEELSKLRKMVEHFIKTHYLYFS